VEDAFKERTIEGIGYDSLGPTEYEGANGIEIQYDNRKSFDDENTCDDDSRY